MELGHVRVMESGVQKGEQQTSRNGCGDAEFTQRRGMLHQIDPQNEDQSADCRTLVKVQLYIEHVL